MTAHPAGPAAPADPDPGPAAPDERGPGARAGPWHAGELAVQDRAGTRDDAEHLTGMLQPVVFPAAAQLLAQVPVLVVAGLDEHGRLWAHGLVGAPPAAAVDPRHVWLQAASSAGDPLAKVLRTGTHVGMTAVDFQARRRVRINGTVMGPAPGGPRTGDPTRRTPGWLVCTEQVYGNCPQRITRRTWLPHPVHPVHPGRAASAEGGAAHLLGAAVAAGRLTEAQQARVRAADTYVLATTSPGGADASHRGGVPSTLTVHNPCRISWPDLRGNNMFNSAGNIALDPRAALWLPPVGDQTSALLISGAAALLWGAATATGRRFVFDIEVAVEVAMPVHLADPGPDLDRAG